jgi:type I restriction enzyme S subunit
MMRTVPLKYLAHVNRQALPDDTTQDTAFRYVDIGAVTDSQVLLPELETTFGAAPSRARRLAAEGATIVSTVRTYLRAIARVPSATGHLVFSTGFAVLEATEGLDSRFLHYACRSDKFVDEVVSRSTGVSYPAIAPTDLSRIKIPVPSLEQQQRIADFLDEQVALLDRAVTLRQQQLALAEERNFTFISDLLARPVHAESGRAGYPWLADDGRVLVKLGRVCDLQTGLTIDAKRVRGSSYPYLRVANVQDGRLDLEEVKSVTVEPALALRCMLQPGDVLMTEGGDLDKLGRGGVWSGEIKNCLHQNHVFALRPHADRLLPAFLAAMTRTHHARRYFEMTGSRTTNLASTNSTKILEFRFHLPSLTDQADLLKQVAASDVHTTTVVRLMREHLSLLLERKQALITAAVTGQVDVSTARRVTA